MEITTIEGAESARFMTGTGDDKLEVSAYLIERTGRWGVNWGAYGTSHPAVATVYADLIKRAADYCYKKNDETTHAMRAQLG